MHIRKKIAFGILFVLAIFALSQGLVMQSIISSTGREEIEAMRREEMAKAEQQLQNYVEIAYNIVESNYENSHNVEWLQKEYGLALNKIIDLAESLIIEHKKQVEQGTLTVAEAQQQVLAAIGQIRYNQDSGYVWKNDTDQAFFKILTESSTPTTPDMDPEQMGQGYVWVNDRGRPYPTMLMHPTVPALNGKVLDDERFNCALGRKENLFAAMVEVTGKYGEGYVEYFWPKPTKDGLIEHQLKLSYVRAVPEWNWILGTGIYVDDALVKAIEKSKQDLNKMRYNSGEGYFWINDNQAPYPVMLMHPTMPELNGKVMDDSSYNVALGETRHLFKAFLQQADRREGGFVTYMWPKPTDQGLTRDQPKLSYVRPFAPFNWIIGTGVYIDAIDTLVAAKIRTINATNYYLLLTILSVAIVLFLLLTTASYLLVDRLFIRKINQANKDLQLEIEERKRTEEELLVAKRNTEVANQAKSTFLANMSHEIRTPMNAVLGLAHLLRLTELSELQRDYIGKLTLSADNLLRIIDDILDFSKIEAGKLELEAIPFSLRSDILENVTQVIGLPAGDKGLELMLDFAPDLPDQLVGDPGRLRQILINLMNNAVKFTANGEITLAVSQLALLEDQVLFRFEIRDSGIGMSQDQLAKLFQAFSQADSSTTRRFGGTGLGLTISKNLAELMGGEIGAQSALGQGSCFWFTARFVLAAEPVEEPLARQAQSLQRLRILVVDDNANARLILSRQLAYFGFDTQVAASGAEALERFRQCPPGDGFDLVLLDWMMPVLDGIETARLIQASPALQPAPAIIMTTAYDRKELLERTRGLDLKAVLTKPIFPSTLLAAILTCFGQAAVKPAVDTRVQLADHVLGARVLLVEDNRINQQVASEILTKAGLEVIVAEDGAQGIARLRADHAEGQPFDAVLMDIQMPVMDGYTASEEIRRLPEFASVPIIAMTANAMAGDRQKALDAGMNDHVAKPIKVAELFRVLGQWVHAARPAPAPVPPPPPAPPQADPGGKDSETDLAEVDGLNSTAGLDLLGGNRSLYLSLLRQFAANYADVPQQLRTALASGDHRQARHLVHTIRGVSGNIGADRLHQAASLLEERLHGEALGPTGSLESIFVLELQHLITGLQGLCGPRTGGQIDNSPSPSGQAPPSRPILTRLRELCAEADFAALEFFLAQRPELAQGMAGADLDNLEQQLRNYAFDEAMVVVTRLIAGEGRRNG